MNNRDNWSSLILARLEADIAYFDARLSLLRDRPASCYQEAQIKAYRELEMLLTDRLSRLSRQGPVMPNSQPGRIEVEELLNEAAAEEGDTDK